MKGNSMKKIIEVKTNYGKYYVKNYILPSEDYYLLIDSGIVSAWDELSQQIDSISEYDRKPGLVVINTHEHWDHIGLNANLVKEKGALIVAHKAGITWMEDHDYQWQQSFEAFSPELIPAEQKKQLYWKEIGKPVKVQLYLQGGEIFKNQNYKLEIIYTPGHSPASICLFEKQQGFLFSGDTVQGSGFFGNLPLYTNVTHFLDSLKRLKKINPCVIFGGHSPRIEGEDVQRIIDEGIRTIESVENATRMALNKLTSSHTLSDIVREVCKELDVNYSIHAFFSVLAHINHMAKHIPIAGDISNRYQTNKAKTIKELKP
jgi:glyoxylase-like metal-dependent hydrolase (beta-lactamase superfamily II)